MNCPLFEYEIEAIDNSEEIVKRMKAAYRRALERIGEAARGFAFKLCPADTSRLRNSIDYKVSGEDAYIGTNVKYAPYVELGTGKYYSGGRKTPWSYQDEKGNWHRTHGQKAQPYLKPAAANHGQTYKNIVEDEMRNG